MAPTDMSSNIEIKKICEFCGKEFTAKTTVTQYCSHACASLAYKQRKKQEKIINAAEQTFKQKYNALLGLDIDEIKRKEFLSIKEAHILLGLSERTFYRLIKTGTINSTKLGKRTIPEKNV